MASETYLKFVPAMTQLFESMSPARRRQFFVLVAFMFAGAVAELATIASVVPFLAMLADPERARDFPIAGEVLRAVGADTNREMLIAAAALFAGVAVVAALTRLQLVKSIHAFVFGFGHELSANIHRRVLSQPYIHHLQHDSTELLGALRKAEILTFDVVLQSFYCAIAILLSLFIVAALIAIDPFASLIAIAFIGSFYLLMTRLSRARLRENSRAFERALDQRIRVVQESIGGIRDIIIDGSRSQFVEEFAAADRRINQAHVSNAIIGSAPRYIIEAASLVLVASLALWLSRDQGLGAAVPILGALALGAQRLLPLVQQVYNGWAKVAGHWLVTLDVLRVLRLPVAEETGGPAAPLPFETEIRLEQVSFAYPGRRAPALETISFSIPRGARLAIVGRTGSGKSTLADLLMGLLEPTRGRIMIDSTTLDSGTRRSWQRSIAHVPQSAFLANTTVARNIAFGMPEEAIDMERVRAAARHAQLDAFVAQLSGGYATVVGERGVALSGGQRQRLAIARAFYKDATVVVLDEATSALDDQTESAIVEALDEMARQGRTIIVIAHRTSSIANCDMIVRLDEGRLVEVETPAAGKQALSGLPSR
ncbi:MAG TPA: ABC transporter ATP-binding protein [Sphingomicrobium sp.]